MASHVLQDIPWGFKYPNLRYDKTKKLWVYSGAFLPEALRAFKTFDFSYERWQEDEINGSVQPPLRGKNIYYPHEHQKEDGKLIYSSFYQKNSSFLLANETGTGKTLSALVGITAIARKEKSLKVKHKGEKATLLIVAPKSVMPSWRQTLQSFPAATQFLRPLVINYHQLNKLLQPPAQARTAKKIKTKNKSTARHGKPMVDWDFVIFDEAHYLKNYPKSTMSLSAVNVAKLNEGYMFRKSPYVLFSTATPGSSPLNMAAMSQLLSPLLIKNKGGSLSSPVTVQQWGEFLKSLDFDVKESSIPGEWSWSPTPWFGKNSDDPMEQKKYQLAKEKSKNNQRRDVLEIGKALRRPDAPFMMRKSQDIAGWPEQNTLPLPLELSSQQKPIYEEVWSQFRRFLNLKPKGSDPKGSLVEMLRYRQKSSLIKVESTIDHIVDNVENGKQVFISCEFTETIERYAEMLRKKRIVSVEYSGRMSTAEKEEARIRFQQGKARVVMCSVVAGVSFHASESLPDGSKATPDQRITYIHDVRQNPLDNTQALGRCHRDGQNSLAYFPYFVDTVDEKIVSRFVERNTNMNIMTGSSESSSEEMENIFRNSAAGSL